MKTNLNESKQNDDPWYDPFDIFGQGIQSFFFLQRMMILIFAILTIVTLPLTMIYKDGQVYRNLGLPAFKEAMIETTLGNLGHSQVKCLHQFINFQ